MSVHVASLGRSVMFLSDGDCRVRGVQGNNFNEKTNLKLQLCRTSQRLNRVRDHSSERVCAQVCGKRSRSLTHSQ